MASRRPTAPRSGATRRAPAAASRRPGAAARPRTAPAAPVVAPRGLSRRAAVLAGLLLVVGITVAPFLRAAVNQQAELTALENEVRDREQRVIELEGQLDRWDDPAFVKAQARQRLKYVMPGEVGYIVLDESPEKEQEADPSEAAARDVDGSDLPWFTTLWDSVQRAGEPAQEPSLTVPTAPAEPVPAPSPAPVVP